MTTFPSFNFATELRDAKRQHSLRLIAQSLIFLHGNVQQAAKHMRRLEKSLAQLHSVLQLNAELVLTDGKRIAAYIVIWLAIAGTYFLDLILVAAVAEYFARRVYQSPAMVSFARLVVPAAILLIELLISCQRTINRQDELEYGRSRRQWVWMILTVLILCVLPSMVIATHMASLPENLTPTLESIQRYQLIGLVAICLVLHGSVLHGGRLALAAQAWFWFKIRTLRLEWKISRRQDGFDHAAAAATNAYIEHVRAVREFNGQFPESQITPGPFDKVARELLHERLGNDYDLTSATPRESNARQHESRPVAEISGA
jgi:hypothetical protein